LGGQSGAELVSGVERAMSAIIWSNVHGCVSLELVGMGFVEDPSVVYDRACRAVLRGLRPDPG
jgi:hypothetical protein